MVLIQCALESPELGKHFKYLERCHTLLRKFSGATQSQKIHEKSDESQEFRMLILNFKTKFCGK